MLDDQPLGLVEATRFLSSAPPRRTAACRSWSPAIAAIASAWSSTFLGERDLRVSPLDPRLGRFPILIARRCSRMAGRS